MRHISAAGQSTAAEPSDKTANVMAALNARIDVLEQKVRMQSGRARAGGLKSAGGQVRAARSPCATAGRLVRLQQEMQKPSHAPALNQELVDLFHEAKELGFVVETSACDDNPYMNPAVGEKISIWRQSMSKVGSSTPFEASL